MKLVEQMRLPGRRQLDKQNQVVRDILVLRERMQGGKRIYTESARVELARLIAEKRPQVLEDHTHADVPPLQAVLGFLDRGYVDNEGAVRADFRYRAGAVQRVEDIVENLAGQVGFSVHITGGGETLEDGSQRVMKVDSISSVDIVTRPSHGGGLWESADPDDENARMRAEYVRAIHETTPAFPKTVTRLDHPPGEALSDESASIDYLSAAEAPDGKLRL